MRLLQCSNTSSPQIGWSSSTKRCFLGCSFLVPLPGPVRETDAKRQGSIDASQVHLWFTSRRCNLRQKRWANPGWSRQFWDTSCNLFDGFWVAPLVTVHDIGRLKSLMKNSLQALEAKCVHVSLQSPWNQLGLSLSTEILKTWWLMIIVPFFTIELAINWVVPHAWTHPTAEGFFFRCQLCFLPGGSTYFHLINPKVVTLWWVIGMVKATGINPNCWRMLTISGIVRLSHCLSLLSLNGLVEGKLWVGNYGFSHEIWIKYGGGSCKFSLKPIPILIRPNGLCWGGYCLRFCERYRERHRRWRAWHAELCPLAPEKAACKTPVDGHD